MKSAAMLGLILAAAAAPAAAGNSATYRLELNVPVTCSVGFTPMPGQGDGAAVGKLSEYCNSPAGYQVRMMYPAGAYEGMVVRLNGSAVVLDGSGSAIIDTADGASRRNIEMVANGRGPERLDGAVLAFAIEPR